MDIIDVAEADAVTSSVKSKKNKQDLPNQCFACGEDVVGPFCYTCGQKNDDCRRSILRLGVESIGDLVTFDGRALRTLGSVILRPGGHVRDYGNGKRSPYSPPVRFFLVISFLFFTTLWMTDTYLFSLRPEIEVNEQGEVTGLDVDARILQDPDIHPYTDEERAAFQNAIDISDDSEIEINGRVVSGQDMFERFLATTEDPTAFNTALNDWIPRLMIILVPLMALLGALFIRGRDALIYDHLLVALNTHSMMFIVLTVSVLGTLFLPFVPREIYAWMFFAGIPVYYFAAQKGAFKRGWIKTTIAVLITLFIYSISMMAGLSLAVVASMRGILF